LMGEDGGGRWLREPLARRGVNIVWSPLTRPLSHQGRGDNGVIFYVIPNTNAE
jgi:hypothetical protein